MSGMRILKNAVYLFASNVLVRLVGAVAAILVARYLGAKDYGILSVALAFSVVTGYFTDLGLSHTFIRDGTKPGADLGRLLAGFFKIRLLFGLGTAVVSVAVVQSLYPDPGMRRVLYWVVMPTILGAAFQGVGAVYFQVVQKMQYTALIRAVAGLLSAGALFLGMALRWPLDFLAPIYGLAAVAGGLLSLWLVGHRVSFFSGWDRSLLRGLGSFTLGGLVIMLLNQMGPLVLERVTDLVAVGYFAAAFRIPSVLYQIPGVLAEAYYPQLFAHGNRRDEDAHLRLNVLELKMMSALGVMMALPFLLYPAWWIHLLFGPRWADAAPALTILSWMVFMQSINYPLADALTTKGMQSRRTAVLVAVLVVGAAAYAVLGARWGSTGGALAALVVECLSMIGFVLMNPTGWRLLLQGAARNAAVAAAAVFLGFLWVRDWSPFVGMPVLEMGAGLAIVAMDSDIRRRLREMWEKVQERIPRIRREGGGP
ncbi:MAG: oligosaccharide flippase family protein [Kyrpidia sp.]|nr:oligosaccharide flippase family protein [Kyrpidia sp.]